MIGRYLSAVDPLPAPTWFDDHITEFWGYLKWFLRLGMPVFMMVVALTVVGMVGRMIVQIVHDARSNGRDRDDDDDDYEVDYY